MTTAAPPSRCPMCGQLEHGSAACGTIVSDHIFPGYIFPSFLMEGEAMIEPIRSLSGCRSCGRLHGEAEPCERETLEQRAALIPPEHIRTSHWNTMPGSLALDPACQRCWYEKALAVGEADRQRLLTEIAALKIALHHQQVAMRRAINICQGHQAAGCNAPLGAALILSEALGAVAQER